MDDFTPVNTTPEWSTLNGIRKTDIETNMRILKWGGWRQLFEEGHSVEVLSLVKSKAEKGKEI